MPIYPQQDHTLSYCYNLNVIRLNSALKGSNAAVLKSTL